MGAAMLIGLVDDQGQPRTWNEIRNGEGSFTDPIPVLLALYPDRDRYCDWSITELLDDPYHAQMLRRYDFFEKPDEIAERLLGSAVHCLLEHSLSDNRSVREERLVREVRYGEQVLRIGGTRDMHTGDDYWDYKTVTMAKLVMIRSGRTNFPDRAQKQLNGYLWLEGIDPTPQTKLYVRLIVRDWRFYEFRKANFDPARYPKGCVLELKTWPQRKTAQIFLSYIKLHQAASQLTDEQLHLAGECDTWNGTRCQHYCPFLNICHFRLSSPLPDSRLDAKKPQPRKTGVVR